MASHRRAYVTVLLVGLGSLPVGAPAVLAAPVPQNVGVGRAKLIVLDASNVTGSAQVTFATKDVAVTNGPAADVEGLRARLHLQYADGAPAGAFIVPPGTSSGWKQHDPSTTRYRNTGAPGGPTELASVLLRPGRLLTAKGAGRGDVPFALADAGPPESGVFVSFEITENGVTTRLCSVLSDCVYRTFDGAGAKLVCRDGVADPTCRAAYPVYRSGTDVRYGAGGTIAIIGDSITVQTRPALEAALDASWFVHVDAAGGTMFRDHHEAARRIGETHPQAVVIHLGTNDVGCALRTAFTPSAPCRYAGFTAADMVADARVLVASVAGACVVGTTTWFGGTINELWREMEASGELAGIVPWAEYLGSLSDEDRGRLLLDGLGHLTAEGTQVLAAMTAEVVEEACRPAL